MNAHPFDISNVARDRPIEDAGEITGCLLGGG